MSLRDGGAPHICNVFCQSKRQRVEIGQSIGGKTEVGRLRHGACRHSRFRQGVQSGGVCTHSSGSSRRSVRNDDGLLRIVAQPVQLREAWLEEKQSFMIYCLRGALWVRDMLFCFSSNVDGVVSNLLAFPENVLHSGDALISTTMVPRIHIVCAA